jgi:hypothetical protein
MTERLVRCANCGTEWSPESVSAGYGHAVLTNPVCPICHLSVAESASSVVSVESVTDLEVQLDALVRGAWASGLDTEAIVHVLRDELAFAAEMRHAGRRFAVQLIDLGPQESELLHRPLRDRRELLPQRRGTA